MTNKERVLKVWPEGMCWGWADGWVIYTHGTSTKLSANEAIGFGKSESEAWADAARRVEAKHGQ